MTTTPIDPSLDVCKRLADLRMWQAEWQRIDRLLEEQLTGIAGNNLLELQQGVHIADIVSLSKGREKGRQESRKKRAKRKLKNG
jgi:hypothetical protein